MSIGGTPVGNMIIKVDLDSAGVEKSMTGLQRQLRSSNKAMGAQLSAFDRGDRSAAKYGVQIKGLSNRHRIQAQMVQEAQVRYQKMTDTYGENSVKAQQASQQLNEQIARYEETGRVLSDTQAEFKEFQRVQDIQSSGWYKAADGMEKFGNHMVTAGDSMQRTGKTLTTKVTLPLGILGGVAIKTGSDYEAGLSKVEAISGATAEQMEVLDDTAREMGRTTVFSASEVTDAFGYMSLAGWGVKDMTSGISGVMDLAAASGEDLALVSDIVTDGLTAFGLEAEHSGRMADLLASTSANANTDVAGLGSAFAYVAPVAGALGFTMEDTAKAIGLMSNSGIKAQKAGTALRTMMTNLASPTAAMSEAMEEYGISLTDSDGKMKSFDAVMQNLRESFGDLDEEQQAQAASTIFGKEAMSGALAIINASESDYDKLTESIKNSDGAAADMAETMQDNLQGSVKELKSMMEDLFIEVYRNLQPALESTVESAKNLTQWFANLSPEVQENIIKYGLLAAAAGPVLMVTGKIVSSVGGLVAGVGGLVKAIGMSKGVGLLGAFAGLGPLAAGGVAVAGLAAVAGGVYYLTKDSQKLYDINTDLIGSMSDQTNALEETVESFDALTKKSELTNDELVKLYNIQEQLNQTNDPGRIDELTASYDEYAKKSGLTKEELEQLFSANDEIIKQAPNVQTSIGENGDAFVKQTDAVHDLIATERELIKIEAERVQAELEHNRLEYLENVKQAKLELAEIQREEALIAELSGLTRSELLEEHTRLYDEITEKSREGNLTLEEKEGSLSRISAIETIVNGEMDSRLGLLREEKLGQLDILATNEEQLLKLKESELTLIDIQLASIGIKESGEEGLRILDESITKNQADLAEINKKVDAGKELTDEERTRHLELETSIQKHQEVKRELYENYGIVGDTNNLVETAISLADKEVQKKIKSLEKSNNIKAEEGNIIDQLIIKNSRHDDTIAKLDTEIKKHGDVDGSIGREINSLKSKKSQNDIVIETVLRELGLHGDVSGAIDRSTKSEQGKGSAVDVTKDKLHSQFTQIGRNNERTRTGTGLERERSAEAGKNVNKNVFVSDQGTVDLLNKRASLSRNKTVHLKESGLERMNRRVSSPVTKFVNLVTSPIPGYAKGTPLGGHPGGMAVVGDGGGAELVTLPKGESFLSPSTDTMVNLPKGTQVTNHRDTERLMRAIPRYAQGTRGAGERLMDSELMKLLALRGRGRGSRGTAANRGLGSTANGSGDVLDLLLEQNGHLKKSNVLLTKLLSKDNDVYLDSSDITRRVNGNNALDAVTNYF